MNNQEELLQEIFQNWKLAQRVVSYYPRFKVFFLIRGKGRVFVASALDKASFTSLFVKHQKRKEEVILVPEDYTCLFIDDPHPKMLEKLPRGTLIVQTSPMKYQLHIPIPKNQKIPPEHRKAFQKACQIIFGSEHVHWNHGRKIPGFYNWKYDPPYPVQTIEMATIKKSLDDFWNEIYPIAQQIIETEKQDPTLNLEIATQKLLNLNITPSTPLKTWNDFYSGDYSQADIKYCIYLISRGLQVQEVLERLLAESPQIFQRKKGHIEDYLIRTVIKAIEYVAQRYKPFPRSTTLPN